MLHQAPLLPPVCPHAQAGSCGAGLCAIRAARAAVLGPLHMPPPPLCALTGGTLLCVQDALVADALRMCDTPLDVERLEALF